MKVNISFSTLDRTQALPSVSEEVKTPRSISCHKLTPLSKTYESTNYCVWSCKPTSCLPSTFLFGPASLRIERTVIYPCEYHKCQIGCPCKRCIGNGEWNTVQDEFYEHQLYHQAPHLSCQFCCQLLEFFPFLSYRKVMKEYIGDYFPREKYVLRVFVSWQFQHRYSYQTTRKSLKCFRKSK